MAFDVGSVQAKITADLSNFKAGIAEAKEQANSLGQNIGNVANNIRSFAEQASVFVGAEALGFGALAKQAIDVASNFEQTQTSFGTLLGSEQKAADLMKEIMTFEQHTPFDIETLTNAAKQMLAFGVNAKDVVPIMSQLTDMSQGQSAKLQELVSIYGQVNSIQQLNGREVLRLSSIGVPIYQALEDHFNKMGAAAGTASVAVDGFGNTVTKVSKNNAETLANANTKLEEQNAQLKILQEEHPKAGLATEKHDLAIMKLEDSIAKTTQTIGKHTISLKETGGQSEVTAEQIKKMISAGEISNDVFNQVLSEMTSKGGLFFQENIRQMSTFSGIMSSTTSQIQYAILNLMGIDIGAANEVRKGGLFDTLRGLAADLLDWLHKLQPLFKEIGENKLFQLAIEGLVIAIASLIVILPILILALNPIVLIVVAIEAVIVALYMAWSTNFLGIRDITNSAVHEVVNFFQNYLIPFFEAFKARWNENWQYNKAVIIGVWDIIVGIIQIAWAVIYTTLKVGIDLFTGNWKKAWADIGQFVDDAVAGIVSIVKGFISFLQGWGGQLIQSFVAPFEEAWNKISAIVNKIKNALDFTQRHSPSVVDIVENGVQLVNHALSGLAFNNTFDVNPQAAFAGAGIGGGMTANEIHIHLDGAVIADSSSATRVGEVIGDAIIKKLQTNIRV